VIPRLVLLHGFTGTPSSWDDVVERLDPVPDVLAPVLPGHDPARPDDGGTDFAEIVRDLAPRIAAWSAGEPVHLAGYSLGARLALGLLASDSLAPDRRQPLFRSATLIGVNPGLRTEAERAERRASDGRWIELLDHGIEAFVDAWERLPLWATQSSVPLPRLAAQRAARLRHHPGGLQRSLRGAGLAVMPDQRPQLPGVEVAVDLMVGADDPKFLRLAEETASLLPQARVVVVSDAGHNLLLERPEAVARELNRKIR
jgi:2-succinyl-6-hydroxy-2,4-cyclohexadiene-1-carboxylate synthase